MIDSSPIAGYEDWPEAVRSAEPYAGVDAISTALGRVLGLRQLGDRSTVLDEGSQRLDGVVIRRLSCRVTDGPNHHHRIIGAALAGGSAKPVRRSSILSALRSLTDCLDPPSVAETSHSSHDE